MSKKIALNKFCPRSGKSVQADSLTNYRNHIVGFCNQGCRDDFSANMNKCSDERLYFDILIKERGSEK